MRIDLYGLTMEAPGVSIYLWTPWRGALLEHKLFDSVKALPDLVHETAPEEERLDLTDPRAWKQAINSMERVLKGWQEEGVDAENEKRSWRWFVEADVDANGYDFKGERSAFWLFLRLSVDRGGPGDDNKGEDIDLNNFGVCIWGAEE